MFREACSILCKGVGTRAWTSKGVRCSGEAVAMQWRSSGDAVAMQLILWVPRMCTLTGLYDDTRESLRASFLCEGFFCTWPSGETRQCICTLTGQKSRMCHPLADASKSASLGELAYNCVQVRHDLHVLWVAERGLVASPRSIVFAVRHLVAVGLAGTWTFKPAIVSIHPLCSNQSTVS